MNIVIFGGTTEGRVFSQGLCENKIPHMICVATDYGEELLLENEWRSVNKGRLNKPQIEKLLKKCEANICVDATHPFATEITENVVAACKNAGTEYIRIKRNGTKLSGDSSSFNVIYCKNHEEAIDKLKNTKGNILLTTGSKDLSKYCKDEALRERIYARVLPGEESIGICKACGLTGKNIIAMQGPFSKELNKALIKDLDIRVLVTKQSGKTGGYFEKYSACSESEIDMITIGEPKEDLGISVDAALKKVGAKLRKIDVKIIGIGPGSDEYLLPKALKYINNCDVILGAERMIRDKNPKALKKNIYLPDDIIEFLKNDVESGRVCVLFSGDTGFYSGAKRLIERLDREIQDKKINCDVEVLPGISSVSYFASKLGVNYHDAEILSLHGRMNPISLAQAVDTVSCSRDTFILLANEKDVKTAAKAIYSIEGVFVKAAFNLSYSDERVIEIPKKGPITLKSGLYVIYVHNEKPDSRRVSGYISDEDFYRDKVPMTKSAVRSLCISRLKLNEDSILYDVGSGSGSVAIEAASLSYKLRVYAVEKKEVALKLMKKNIKAFKGENIEVIFGTAPEALEDLPSPTHVFIGGSSGNMKDIISLIRKKNPNCRLVITAVSFETLQEIIDIQNYCKCKDFNVMQVSVTNTITAGKYHMQKAENPIWICETELCDE